MDTPEKPDTTSAVKLTREQQLHAQSQAYIAPRTPGKLKAQAATAILGLVNRAMAKVAVRAADKAGDAAVQPEDLLQQGALGVLKYLDNIATQGKALPDVRAHYLNVSAIARSAIERPALAEGTALRHAAEAEFVRERGAGVSDAFSLIARREREERLATQVLPKLPLTDHQRSLLAGMYETNPNGPEIRGAADLAKILGTSPNSVQSQVDVAVTKLKNIVPRHGLKPGDLQ
jgi:hypothetical protein